VGQVPHCSAQMPQVNANSILTVVTPKVVCAQEVLMINCLDVIYPPINLSNTVLRCMEQQQPFPGITGSKDEMLSAVL
jgi:hypothetical protein